MRISEIRAMRSGYLLVAALLSAALFGCVQRPDVEEIYTIEPPDQSTVEAPPVATDADITPVAPDELWEYLDENPKVGEGTKFYSTVDSVRCPEVEVSTLQGKEIVLRAGDRGYVAMGEVTILVFWSMNELTAGAAFIHAADLASRYGELGVRAIGFVEKAPGYQGAGQFADTRGIRMPLYYDDLEALEELADAAGSDAEREFPAIFIVDRHLRLRFYRRKFDLGWTTKVENGRCMVEVSDTAPEGQKVDDYLRRILQEGWTSPH
jgi:hypothetical protein